MEISTGSGCKKISQEGIRRGADHKSGQDQADDSGDEFRFFVHKNQSSFFLSTTAPAAAIRAAAAMPAVPPPTTATSAVRVCLISKLAVIVASVYSFAESVYHYRFIKIIIHRPLYKCNKIC